MSFAEKWHAAGQQSRLALGIAPRVADLPAPMARYDDPFLPFGRAIIEVTADLVGAYVFDLASYFTLGAAGMRALERTIPLVPKHLPIILHAPFVSAAYARGAYEEGFFVDAVTLADPSVVSAYTENPAHGAFVLHSLVVPTGENIGVYDEQGFKLGETRMQWIVDPIIHATGQFDFAEVMREKAEFYRQASMKG